MGDIVLTTPLLNALRQAYPGAHIIYLAEKPYISLLEHHPDVSETLSLDRNSTLNQVRTMIRLLGQRFDIAIDLFGNPRSAVLTFLSGARRRIGGHFRGRRHFYTDTIKDDGKIKTAIQFHLGYLNPLGIRYQTIEPYIRITAEEEHWAKTYLKKRGFDLQQKIIAIHPGATWPAKRWFADRFAVLANRLTLDPRLQILFTMGPGEEELVESVIRSCNFSVIQPKILTLRQLAAVLKIVDVFICNDCGPMHVAPAVGTRTVGIFGPGEPDIWFPYDQKKGHRLVYRHVDCSRCHRDLCDEMDCMRKITVRDVFEAAMDSLEHKRPIRDNPEHES
jgi:ADP-heptose:LPS heptosyltransferase